ncbi:MAG TPA: translation initiation factor IF-2 N-terminal domain-containing protein, partial [Labilithrix sp.]|nr:translation initiation factor IF-2 N-terminal domain-containing protein [Labilithrix sp.]
MSKVRVYEVAKQLNLDPKQVVTLFQSIGVTDVRNHMSSVEAEAVERLKRNLEKQKTHDVVEERIRRGAGTVLKRRAVAKAPTESAPGSLQPVSAAQPSTPELNDVASRRDISQLAIEPSPSQAPQTDVLAKGDSARILEYREVPEDRRSAQSSQAPSSEVALPSVPAAPPSARPSSRTDGGGAGTACTDDGGAGTEAAATDGSDVRDSGAGGTATSVRELGRADGGAAGTDGSAPSLDGACEDCALRRSSGTS